MSAPTCRGVGAFNADPDPDKRLENWYGIARSTISREVCESLYSYGFEQLAEELMRQRGEQL